MSNTAEIKCYCGLAHTLTRSMDNLICRCGTAWLQAYGGVFYRESPYTTDGLDILERAFERRMKGHIVPGSVKMQYETEKG